MARPDPALLDPARYPAHFTVTTRFGDLDPNRHINNVAAASMLEDVRARFNHSMGLMDFMAEGDRKTVVASVTLEYIDELYYPASILGVAGVLSIGRTSWTIGALLVQDRRAAVFTNTTAVFLEDGRPNTLPDGFRATLGRNLITLPAPLCA